MTHGFRDFKNFDDASIGLWSPLTVLIGRNGSGKTNVIEGVELLAALAHGRTLSEVADVGRGGGAFEVRGGLSGCARRGRESFELRFHAVSVLGPSERHAYEYSLRIAAGPEPQILEERFSLVGRPTPVFEAKKNRGRLLHVVYDNFARGPNKPSFSVPADRTVLSQYPSHVPSTEKTQNALRFVAGCQAFLRAAFVLDPEPHAMRVYHRIGERQLRRNGANLSSTLYALKTGTDAERAALTRIRGWISQLPEDPIEEIEFVTTKLQDVILAFKRPGETELFDARMLSDGTLRALSVLTALETAAPRSRIIIEEFDNGLHPSRVKILTEAVIDCATRRKLNVLVTTHNPATLDALPDAQHQHVVFCAWDARKQASRLISLPQLPHVDVLLESHHLGDLLTKGLLERQLADAPPARKEEMRKWAQGLGR